MYISLFSLYTSRSIIYDNLFTTSILAIHNHYTIIRKSQGFVEIVPKPNPSVDKFISQL